MDDDWVAVLRTACDTTSQKAVARRLSALSQSWGGRSVSASLINQVLKGTYVGDLKRIEELVVAEYRPTTVQCPVLGEIPHQQCLYHQAQPFKPVNPQRVRLFRACRSGCPYSRIKDGE